MNIDWLLAYIAFGVSTMGTPGPNNMMLAASGATFGLRRSLPHMAGITAGFPLMVVAVGLGLGELLRLHPAIGEALKWAGGGYLLFLAWKIATAAGVSPEDGKAKARGRPLSFLQAAAFQWVNPKGWTMIMAMLPVYAGRNGDYTSDVLVMAALSAVISVFTTSGWTLIGMGASRLLTPGRLVWFNRLMALLMVASLVTIWA